MYVDFKDLKNVEVKGFRIIGTYDGHLEGSRQSVTKTILANNESKKGILYIKPVLEDEVLKPFEYKVYSSSDWEHRLELVWYDNDIPAEMPLLNYIQQITQEIEFKPNCTFVDIDKI